MRIEENPVCVQYPHLAELLIFKLSPPLKKLNGVLITQEISNNAMITVQRHLSYIEVLYENSQLLDLVKALESKMIIHRQMMKLGLVTNVI